MWKATTKSRASRCLPMRSNRRSWSESSEAAGGQLMRGNGTGATATLTKADFQSDAETRWCPGCGDYAILAAVQGFLPELGIPPERTVFVSGIGCAGRF